MAKRIPCSVCGALRWQQSGIDSITCRECRHSYSAGCRCDECREANTAACRERRQRARSRGYVYVRPERRGASAIACDHCGEPLLRRGPGASVHQTCRQLVLRAEAKRRRAKAKLDKAAAGVSANPRNAFTAGTCRFCLESFVRRNTPSPYCSAACRRADRPKPVRPSVRRAIFERDDFVCQLCSESTEPDADPMSDWAPTIDHVIPQSKGGSHDPENLRCAHRWCNSVRGDETHYTEADLRLVA